MELLRAEAAGLLYVKHNVSVQPSGAAMLNVIQCVCTREAHVSLPPSPARARPAMRRANAMPGCVYRDTFPIRATGRANLGRRGEGSKRDDPIFSPEDPTVAVVGNRRGAMQGASLSL